VGELAGDLLGVFLVVPQTRVGCLVLELVDASAQLLDVHNRFAGAKGGVEGVQVCNYVGMHGSQGYRVPTWALPCVTLSARPVRHVLGSPGLEALPTSLRGNLLER